MKNTRRNFSFILPNCNKMFSKIFKIVCKLFGIACLITLVKEKLAMSFHTFQHRLKTKARQMVWMFVVCSIAFILCSLGLRFLLLGLAFWLNQILASTYLGFLLVALLCFLMVGCIVLMVRRNMNNQDLDHEKMTDGQ